MQIFIFSFLLTFALIKLFYPLAGVIGLLDSPGVRKHHKGMVPLVGGLAVFFSFCISLFFFGLFESSVFPLLSALLVVVVLGVTDDYMGLNFKLRLIIQLLIASLLVFFSGAELNSVGNILGIGELPLGYFVVPFTMFAIIGNINAFNMIDGIDGLSACLAIVALFSLYLSGNNELSEGHYPVLMTLIASLSAFLLINLFSRKKVFMGDSGSMLIGLVVAYFVIIFSQEGRVNAVTCLWVIAIPIMDTICIMIRRVKKGQSPFLADREHLHHIFLRAGYSDKQALVIIVMIASILAAIGLLADKYQVPEWFMFLSYLIIFAGYYQLIQHSWVLMRWLKVIHKPYFDP